MNVVCVVVLHMVTIVPQRSNSFGRSEVMNMYSAVVFCSRRGI
jgi:hypothetical protein